MFRFLIAFKFMYICNFDLFSLSSFSSFTGLYLLQASAPKNVLTFCYLDCERVGFEPREAAIKTWWYASSELPNIPGQSYLELSVPGFHLVEVCDIINASFVQKPGEREKFCNKLNLCLLIYFTLILELISYFSNELYNYVL